MDSLLIILVLLTLNAFFVAAEFALVKVRGFRVDKLAVEGSATARMTTRILGNLEAYLAACQLGITMASLGLGWVGEPAVAALLEPLFRELGMSEKVLHTTAFLIGFLVFSSLHIVIGEQVPKSYAIRQSDKVSLWCAYPLHVAYLIVWPLNWLLDRASKSILSLFNVEEATHAEIYTGEELRELVSSSKDHGSLEEAKADMLHNIFEFDQRSVGRIMVPRHDVKVLDIAASSADNLAIITSSGFSRFPLVDSSEKEKILGIILVKEIFAALLDADDSEAIWSNLQSYALPTLIVPEKQKISVLFEQMRAERKHIAYIVDEYGAFQGIVTLEDLIEEIMGEIEDETDVARSSEQIIEKSDTSWEINGLASLSDVSRVTGLAITAELEANTLSGLIMAHFERMPEEGAAFQQGDYMLTVLTMENRHVGKVLVEKTVAQDTASEEIQ